MSDSLITKKAIASGIKELTKQKNFDKITVTDITEICGLNRQTFYYHFQDKYELVNWIYYNEVISLVINDLTYENCGDKVQLMLSKMKSEDYFYINTLKASVRDEFEEYLFKVIRELFCDIIEKIAGDNKMDESEVKFIAEFYAYGTVGLIVAWAQNGMKETPEYLTTLLRNMAYGTERFATARYQERFQKKLIP